MRLCSLERVRAQLTLVATKFHSCSFFKRYICIRTSKLSRDGFFKGLGRTYTPPEALDAIVLQSTQWILGIDWLLDKIHKFQQYNTIQYNVNTYEISFLREAAWRKIYLRSLNLKPAFSVHNHVLIASINQRCSNALSLPDCAKSAVEHCHKICD
jgi:hypothetical protein